MSTPDAETLYRVLGNDTSRLRGVRRLRYWCAMRDRCLLLDAIDVRGQILLHQKRFKQSTEVNLRRSSEAGRAANTSDGENHWKPRSYWISESALSYPADSPGSVGLAIQCDHVGVLPDGGEIILTPADFAHDWTSGHTEVRVRSDGTRFPIH